MDWTLAVGSGEGRECWKDEAGLMVHVRAQENAALRHATRQLVEHSVESDRRSAVDSASASCEISFHAEVIANIRDVAESGRG
jgi:hypothetical protein